MTPSTLRRGSRAPSASFGPLSTVRYTINGVSFDMVRVPPGRFVDGEGPARRELLVSRPFELGVAPVTQALWRAVMGSSPSDFRGEDRPVEQVSWVDVQSFVRTLSQQGLPGFRLPTEAVWVWAARCGVQTRWPGEERVEVVAVVQSSQTAATAGLSGSVVGAFDFSGNVREWVEDRRLDPPSGGVDIHYSGSGLYRIDRGGSYAHTSEGARVADRGYDHPSSRSLYLGFRLARAAL